VTARVVSDEAKRFSEQVNLHLICGNAYRWVAIRLSDGGSDGVLYDSGADAIRHQLHETQCGYLPIPPDGITPRTADTLLRYWRQAYDNGWRPSRLRPEVQLILPTKEEDL
jgi:hypothetical protein